MSTLLALVGAAGLVAGIALTSLGPSDPEVRILAPALMAAGAVWLGLALAVHAVHRRLEEVLSELWRFQRDSSPSGGAETATQEDARQSLE